MVVLEVPPRLPPLGYPSLQTAVHQQQEALHQVVTQTFKVDRQATRLERGEVQLVFMVLDTALMQLLLVAAQGLAGQVPGWVAEGL